MKRVFTSYARDDASFVDQVKERLEQSGIDLWTDREDIAGGQSWRAQISDAIKSSDALMVVLSQSSSQSRYVVRELTLADENRKQIVPVLFQKCQIPGEAEFQLAGLHMIDFTIQPFEQALAQLLQAFGQSSQQQPQQQYGSPPPPPYQQPQNVKKTLAQILPGNWQVQLNVQTFWGPQTGMMHLSIGANYSFQGRNQMLMMQGQWSIPQFNQLVLSGTQTDGFTTAPYNVIVQFTQIMDNQLQGITSGNELVICHRT